MQIVRDLGGYSLGRSDLVRRAMSKKKASVMQQERKNFVYGNEEEGVPGCLANGISEGVANKIFDEMTDFASYAFNKSHAAAYAVVSYQTAYLKHYYPREFMAALMTSVISNPAKVAGYILTSRAMGINILPPDINESGMAFTVTDEGIRYSLFAIKRVGGPLIEAIVRERESAGPFTDLRGFLERMSGTDLNRLAIENLIKAGALDCLGGNRRQLIMAYPQVMSAAAKQRKNAVTGQMTLMDLFGGEDRDSFKVTLPDVDEFPKEQLLAFEKEVLGIYISGHPLEEYESLWKKHISATTGDLMADEETGKPKAADESIVTLGGMVENPTVKYTRQNKAMAIFHLEDLVGSVEVLVFPKIFERYANILKEDARIFVKGRVSVEEESDAKLLAQEITLFDDLPRDIWIRFEKMADYENAAKGLGELISGSDGRDRVVIYVNESRAVKRLGARWSVSASPDLIASLQERFGQDNVRITWS